MKNFEQILKNITEQHKDSISVVYNNDTDYFDIMCSEDCKTSVVKSNTIKPDDIEDGKVFIKLLNKYNIKYDCNLEAMFESIIPDDNTHLYFVVGVDELENIIFAECTTHEKAKKAKEILDDEGYRDMIEIRRSNISIDTLIVNHKVVKL